MLVPEASGLSSFHCEDGIMVGQSRWNRMGGALIAACATASAGPDWTESGEAGSLPAAADEPSGTGPIRTISGSLDGPSQTRGQQSSGDFEDMYLIEICDPEQFTARTDGVDQDGVSGATFRTGLFLFDANGFGVLANLQTSDPMGDQLGSLILPFSTDGNMATIPGPGRYFIAISGAPNQPVSGMQGPIFAFDMPTEVSGPDGPGQDDPITAWTSKGETGEYVIALTGAAFPSACEDSDLNGDKVVDARDLAILLGSWGNPYTSQDLSALLGSWGDCRCPCEGLSS